MIIKNIGLKTEGDWTTLSAICKIRKLGWDRVYFKVSSKKENLAFADASPFAAALLLPSMRRGEDLIIKGSVSKQLFDGMQAIMSEILSWNIGLKPITIRADSLAVDSSNATHTGSFFSGGVDSFYTFLKHQRDPKNKGRVDTFILINGFDIELADTALWQSTLKNVQAIARSEKVELITVESNIHELIEPVLAWDFAHGGCLAAVGLFLRGAFKKIYIPSTFSVEEQVPWGSHLKIDHHWSSESLQYIHDGTEVTRIGKIINEVSKSPTALKHLKVCYVNKDGAYNCGRCSKCIRTMISFYAAGALEKSKTLPNKIDIDYVANLPSARNEGKQIFAGETQNLEALRARQLDPALQQAILDSIDKTNAQRQQPVANLKYRFARLRRKVAYVDHIYLRGRIYAGYNNLFGKRYVSNH